ncbi:DNA polymerase III subunit delta' [Vibrio sp. PP-XX7]
MLLYPWFRTSWTQWCRSLERDSVSSATLLVVKDGMGDADFIDLLVRSLLCDDGHQLCGVCHSCRLMDAKSHPDFHLVEPEKAGKPITVEQVRQINLLAQESSQFSGYRVIVIRPADAMNESAANALLKTLEESPAQCRFILTTATITRILPTILSRCRQLHVPEPPQQMIVDWLFSETSQRIPPMF